MIGVKEDLFHDLQEFRQLVRAFESGILLIENHVVLIIRPGAVRPFAAQSYFSLAVTVILHPDPLPVLPASTQRCFAGQQLAVSP